MKVFVNRCLLGLRGEKILDRQGPDAQESSLGAMLIEGLGRPLKGDEGHSGSIKMRRYRLAQKIMDFMEKNKEPEAFMEISELEVQMMKKRLEFLPTMLLGPVYDALGVEDESLESTEDRVGL